MFWGVVKGGEGWPEGEEVESKEKSYERERERERLEREWEFYKELAHILSLFVPRWRMRDPLMATR